MLRLFKKRSSGYIAILLCIAIPILLYSIKYTLDTSTQYDTALVKDVDVNKRDVKCAKEVALAVAQNWNPGLTLTQQRDAIMKIADAVYNDNARLCGTVVGNAIPGLDIKTDYKIVSNPTFSGMITKPQTVVPAIAMVQYENVTKYFKRQRHYLGSTTYPTWNPSFAMWRAVDKGTDAVRRESVFDEVDNDLLAKGVYSLKHHDIYTNPLIAQGYMTSSYPTNVYYSSGSSNFYLKLPAITNSISTSYSPSSTLSYTGIIYSYTISTYKRRITPLDPYCVQVSISGDRIMARTGSSDVGYASPAQCNVDIILAIPTNAAANNENNRDAASDVAEEPSYSSTAASTAIATWVENTPIYQIGQACKSFVKNFYHTRGVNMGLIPYSAKVSISPDKISYASTIPAFVRSNITNSEYPVFNKIRGTCLYGATGIKNYSLLENNYSWNTNLTGCPIMCRRGTANIMTDYGGNYLYNGLFTYSNPSSDGYKFRRMNLTPCYLGYANLVSFKCDETCTTFLPNPYYMIEFTADLPKIYELCNALYPIYDPNSVSNFVFIPVEWANNFFQSWTTNTTASATSDQLSRPSKMTAGRKKALILIVNKPDWFEPGELTYLGFHNDYAELPMVESDKIRFDIDYSDSTKKFIDGTAYDGTIQGQKKILKCKAVNGSLEINADSGFYECASGTVRLSFPQKMPLKLVVKPGAAPMVTFYGDNGVDTCKLGSATGNNVPLNKPYLISSSPQTFVFPGRGTNLGNGYTSSFITTMGNFSHNLTPYKVRYDLSNCSISNVVLKNQVIRNYFGALGYTSSSTKPAKTLILNDGTLSDWTGYKSGSSMSTYYRYCPDVVNNSKAISIITGLHCDACMTRYICDSTTWMIPSMYASFWDVYVYGLQKCNIYQNYSNDTVTKTLTYYASGGNQQRTITRMSSPIQFSQQSAESNSVHFSLDAGTGRCYLTYSLFHNPDDKIFKANITNGDIDNNSYVGLQKLSSPVNAIPAGNYIVFQGEGELHVTVSSANPTTTTALKLDSDLTFTNVSGDSGKHSITTEQTFWIEPSQISDSKINGEYYIDMDLNNVRLVSAEISNRNILSEEILDHYETAKIDFSAGQTSSPSLSGFYLNGGVSTSGSKTLYLPSDKRGTVSITVKAKPTVSVSWSKQEADVITTKNLSQICSTGWHAMCFDNYNKRVIALNLNGIVAESTDDGKSWTQISEQTGTDTLNNVNSDEWVAIYCVSQNSVIALNRRGYVASSSDKGKTWIQVSNSLNSLSSQTRGWFSGEYYNNRLIAMNVYDGTIAASTDKGKTWTKISTSLNSVRKYYCEDICYDSANNVLVEVESSSGASSAVANSSDGGVTWKNVDTTKLNAINAGRWDFIGYNPVYKIVLSMADNGKVAYSKDGGVNWTALSSLSNISSSGIWFFISRDKSGNGLLALNYNGTVAKGTVTVGASSITVKWEKLEADTIITTKDLSTICVAGWHAMCFDDYRKRIIALNLEGTIAASTDDGKNWTRIGLQNVLTSLYGAGEWVAIYHISNNYLVAFNAFGHSACSEDGGEAWLGYSSLRSISSNIQWLSGEYYNNHLVAIGNDGTVATSSNKGQTWTKVSNSLSSVKKYSCEDICYDSANNVLVEVESNHGLLSAVANSRDEGKTWKNVDTTKLDAINPGKWYFIGYNPAHEIVLSVANSGKVAYSSDGGVNWTALSSLSNVSSSGAWFFISRDKSGNGLLALNNNGTVAKGTVTKQSSTFRFTCGSDTSIKTITGTQTFNIDASSMSSVTFSTSNIELVSATLQFPIYRTEIKWENPSYPDGTSRGIDWTNSTISIPNYIYLEGPHNNYKTNRGYHSLHYSSCYISSIAPQIYQGDITGICEEYAPSLFKGTMAFYGSSNTATLWSDRYATGLVRGFRKYTRRNTGSYGCMSMDTNGAAFNNMADIIATEITMPYNTVLYKNNYQKLNDKSTLTESKAVSDLTRAQCTSLKQAWSSNLRIYVIKYRKQQKYKTFPFYQSTQSDADHDYSAVDSCASSSAYLYDVSTETALKNALTAIEQDIKTFAGYTAAKNVN